MLELKRATKDFRDAARIGTSVAIVCPILAVNASIRIGLVGVRYTANKVAGGAEVVNQAMIRAEKKLENPKLSADAKLIAQDLRAKFNNIIPFKHKELVPEAA